MSQDNASQDKLGQDGATDPAACASPALAGAPAAAMAGFTRFIGLDVHKRMIEACVLDAGGVKLHGEQFACTPAELERFARQYMGPHVAVALEATSNTWAVCNVLDQFRHGGLLKVSNPLKTKAIAQASVKTDKVDAGVLGQLLRCDYLPGVWAADEPTRRLRQTVARRTALVQDRTAVKNRIHSALAGELIAAPTARLYDKSGLQWLRETPLPEPARRFIDSDLRLLEGLEKEIALLDEELAQAAHKNAQAKLLMTLPGVDYVVAMTLLAALGDISRFKDGDHAAGYLGLAPSTKQSADHCYHGPITKHGNSHARWMLVEAAQHLDKHPGPLGVFFRRLAKKKNRNVAVVATARKLVTIALLMLKHNEPYRYAQPKTVAAKLARLRIRAGGKKRKGGNPRGSGRHPNYGTGKNQRRTPALAEVCQSEGLPAPIPLDQLPSGEKRMLQETGTLQAIETFARPQTRPRALERCPGRDPIALNEPGAAASGAGHPAPSPAPKPPPARGRSPYPLALPLQSLEMGQATR